MSRSNTILQALRAHLRKRGMTYRELARALGISEPTVKRDFSRGDFSLSRLDRICDVLDVSIAELAQGQSSLSSALTELSEKQEKALVRDRKLLLVTYLVVNAWTFAQIIATFALDENDLVVIFMRLDELGIVDFRPPRRVRRLTARNFSWRKDGPVQAFFVQRVAPDFLAGSFDADSDELHFLGGLLSPLSRARMKASIARLVQEFEVMAHEDARLPLAARDSCSAMLALRQWEFSDFTKLRR